jgi:glycopeptide antibiotics resistance protein
MNRQIPPHVFIALVVLILILIGSLAPNHLRSDFQKVLYRPIAIPGPLLITPHSVLHYVSFAALGSLAALARSRVHRLFGLIAVMLLGFSIETLQYLFSTNPFETWDLRDDAIGAGIGYILACAARSLRRHGLGRYDAY